MKVLVWNMFSLRHYCANRSRTILPSERGPVELQQSLDFEHDCYTKHNQLDWTFTLSEKILVKASPVEGKEVGALVSGTVVIKRGKAVASVS